jgi:AcrR family transcriptional regulator
LIRPPAPSAATFSSQSNLGSRDTRERILEVALDLFIAQGYDGTSLRQIAEEIPISKAALYYYFKSKPDVLLALHARLDEVGMDAIDALSGDLVTLAQWEALLALLLDQVLAHRKLFLLQARNQAALEMLHSREHDTERTDIQSCLRWILADQRIPTRNRVRIAAGFGIVFSSLLVANELVSTESTDSVTSTLRKIIHGIMSSYRSHWCRWADWGAKNDHACARRFKQARPDGMG